LGKKSWRLIWKKRGYSKNKRKSLDNTQREEDAINRGGNHNEEVRKTKGRQSWQTRCKSKVERSTKTRENVPGNSGNEKNDGLRGKKLIKKGVPRDLPSK